jgi:hypothetical protein
MFDRLGLHDASQDVFPTGEMLLLTGGEGEHSF